MFERESETYKKELPRLLREPGRFVLIRGAEVGGVYDTWRDAVQIGYEKYGVGPFFVKQIRLVESLEYLGYPVPQAS